MEASADQQLSGIYVEHLERVICVMREKYPSVLAANRRFEEETGFENKLGMNNLADALSHIGTLLTEAPDLSRDHQAGQVTLFEDHLRRSMMEAWEQMLDFQLGEIDETWEKYLEEARPLQVQHQLEGAPTDGEIDRLRIQYKHLLDRGREEKRAADWPGWEAGTDTLIEACKKASELHDAVKQSLAAAKAYKREHRRDRRVIAMWLVGLLITFGGGYALAEAREDDNGGKTAPQQQEQKDQRQQPQKPKKP